MRTFNIWIHNKENSKSNPTGPWVFGSACLADDEKSALETAKMRYGLNGKYMIYAGL